MSSARRRYLDWSAGSSLVWKIDSLSVLNTLRQSELHLPLVIIQPCHSPGTVRVEPVLVHLEPLQSCYSGRQCAIYFGQVDHDRTQVTGVDGVSLVGRRRRVERVVPFCRELVAGLDVDDVCW